MKTKTQQKKQSVEDVVVGSLYRINVKNTKYGMPRLTAMEVAFMSACEKKQVKLPG